MANTPPRSEAEREVRNIEAHVDNVAERQLELVGTLLKNSLEALEVRIGGTGQTQVLAAAKLIEERVSHMLDTQTATLQLAVADAVTKVNDSTGSQLAAQKSEFSTMLDKQTGDIGNKLETLIPQIRNTMIETEVSFLARLLRVIDARMKMLEARLLGYAGPVQLTEAALNRMQRIHEQIADATQLMDIAKDAVAEETKPTEDGRPKNERTKAEYRYLAERSYELALSQLKSAMADAKLEAHDAINLTEAEAEMTKIEGLIADAKKAQGALQPKS